MLRRGVAVFLISVLMLCGLTGCSSSGGSTPNIVVPGRYAPPAQPTPRLRVAVPDVGVGNAVGTAIDVDLMAIGSDELFNLLQTSDRFDLIERLRLRQVLAEQKLLDMVQPGRLIHPGAIHGVDTLFLATINELTIKKQHGPDTVSVTGLMQATHIEKVIPRLIIDANIDLQMVDVKTGAINVASSDKVHLVATPEELGLKLKSDQLETTAEVHLTPEDTRVILRYVFDKPLRPMLPRIDRFALVTTPPPPTDTSLSQSQSQSLSGANTTQPTNKKPKALLICPDCGYKLTGEEQFCPNCHKKLK
jgi:curli biogenesis system outer membrane secretion channel CsgG